MRKLAFVLCMLAASAATASAQKKYTGPRPPKPDIPYLLHVSTLVETEVATAKESREKDNTVYTVSGATSPARTPLSEPILLFQADRINPDHLALFRMEVRNGQRTLLLPSPGKRGKSSARPLYLMVTPLAGGLFKVEVNEFLADGEYCLSPESSNQVFCFTTY
jgi:hypothetical protein